MQQGRAKFPPYLENVNAPRTSIRKCLLMSPLLAVFRVKTLTTYLSSCLSLSSDSHDLCFLLSSSSLLCVRYAPNNLFHFCHRFLLSCFLSDFSSPLFIRYIQPCLRYSHPNFLFLPQTAFDIPDILFILCLFLLRCDFFDFLLQNRFYNFQLVPVIFWY
jgi:hypothetical protein